MRNGVRREQSGDGLVGPLSGAGRTWKALHHLFLRPPKRSLSKRWTAFPVPDRVRINSWESLRSVIRLSVDFLAGPSVLFRLVLQLPLMSRRSEEHTSELQSLMRISYAVFCLKKNNKHTNK